MIYPLNSIVLYIPPDNRTDWSNRDMMTTAKHNRRIKLLGENKWDLGSGVYSWGFHFGETEDWKLSLEVFMIFGLRSFVPQTFVPGRLLSRLLFSNFCSWEDFWSPADFWSMPGFCSQKNFLIPRGLLITELLFPRLLFTGLKFPGLLFPSGYLFLDILF